MPSISTKKTSPPTARRPQRDTPKQAARTETCLTDLEKKCIALNKFNSILEMDLSGNILAANGTFLKIFGYRSEDIIGRHHSILLPEAKRHSKEYNGFWARLKNGESHAGEFERRAANGDTIWIHGSYYPVIDNDTGQIKILKITTDITGQKKTREDLYRNQELLMEARQLANLGTYVFDMVNDSWTSSEILDSIFGIGPDYERTYAGWISAIHPEWRDGIEKYFLKKIRSGDTSFDKEYKIIRQSDKTERWVHDKGSCKLDEKGKVVSMTGTVMDITGQKDALEALRLNELFLKEAQIIARLGTYKYDLGPDRWASSEMLDDIFGIGPDFPRTFEGWISIISPEWRDNMNDYFMKEVVARKGVFDKTYKIIRQSDKAERWVHGKGILKCDEKGNILSLNGTIMDITERKMTEQHITRISRMYRVSNRISEMLIRVKSVDVLYQEVCNIAVDTGGFIMAWMGILDEETDQILPVAHAGEERGYLSDIKVVSTAHRPEGEGPAGQAMRTGKYFVCNDIEHDPGMCPWRKKALSRGYRSCIGMPVRKFSKDIGVLVLYSPIAGFFNEEEINQLVSMTDNVAFALEVIEHEKVRRQAEAMSLKLSHAIEQSPTSIVITDLQGNIEYVNPKFTDITGYSREEVMGKNPRILKSGHTPDEEYKKIWEQLLSGREWRGEFLNKKKNGDLFWELAVIAPVINKRGEIINFIAVKEDITERKRADETIAALYSSLEEKVKERTAELQEANTALEAFSYSASHDLRAPLRSIIGFSGLIKKNYSQDFNKELMETFEHIDQGARRMDDIIVDMLALSRSGKEKLRITEVDFGLLFAQVWEGLKISEPNHALIEFGALPTCPADASMMEQVIVNLLANAIKYSSKRGHPLIMVSCIEVHGDYIFSIRDNGAGFDMKMYSKLFNPFQRLHGMSDFEGTGIGLALVKRIVEKHGGHVWAEGMVEQGATFHFSLRAPRVHIVSS
jgi:PAS domain S-box-containing protein